MKRLAFWLAIGVLVLAGSLSIPDFLSDELGPRPGECTDCD